MSSSANEGDATAPTIAPSPAKKGVARTWSFQLPNNDEDETEHSQQQEQQQQQQNGDQSRNNNNDGVDSNKHDDDDDMINDRAATPVASPNKSPSKNKKHIRSEAEQNIRNSGSVPL